MKIFIIIGFMFLFLMIYSCDSFKLSGKKKVGEIENIDNGIYKIEFSLDSNTPGWNIHIGDPFDGFFKGNVVGKNKNIMSNNVVLTVINRNKFNLLVWTSDGQEEVKPQSSVVYFEGTFENLITNTNPITISGTKGTRFNIALNLQFEEKNVEIDCPIPIIAEWHDAL